MDSSVVIKQDVDKAGLLVIIVVYFSGLLFLLGQKSGPGCI